ncbi:unnamed protein product [Soboliphyme baturini]|uniref:Olfactomedin-like domain-containing protein n=1 Tax=Soboliphyme baturini TaxID=241478 RepID=A0A183J447_9BILA|nr:unnamed protein product [Soboliphyme baturini]
MRDAILVETEDLSSRRWVFDGYLSPVLYEYRNELDLLYKKQSAKYFLDYSATGTGAIIFNGSFYYHRYGSQNIVRYDLNSTEEVQRPLPNVAYQVCIMTPDIQHCANVRYLYGLPHNFVDFAADENGIWVVYSNTANDSLTAAKIQVETLEVIHQWFIDIPKNVTIANTFIMCGILYGLKSATNYDTEINFAFDLYNDEFINITVNFRNPFQQTTMLDYNPVDRRLYYFDHGNLLTVPVRTKGIDD